MMLNSSKKILILLVFIFVILLSTSFNTEKVYAKINNPDYDEPHIVIIPEEFEDTKTGGSSDHISSESTICNIKLSAGCLNMEVINEIINIDVTENEIYKLGKH